MATITASSISSSDSLERFRQEFNTLRSDVSNINSAAISITNESNNRILTSVSTNTLNAEESLTFDGSTFAVGGAVTVTGLTTLSGNLVIPNGGNIGSVGDTDAIAISTDGTVTFSSDVTLTGDSANAVWDKSDNALEFADNAKALFGNASDLQIYHDGSNSVIADFGTGVLDIKSDGAAIQLSSNTGELYAYFANNGSAQLYYDNSKKLETSSAGINVTGTATMSGNVVIADAGNIGSASDTDAIAIASNGVVTMNQIPVFSAGINVSGGTIAGTLATAAQTNITSVGTLTGLTVSGDVTFTGASYNVVWDKSDNALEFADNAKAIFGAGSDLQIFHDGSNSLISDQGTGALLLRATDFQMTNAAGSQYIMQGVDGGAATLYHAGSAKIATTSGGINVTGTVTSDGADLDGAVTINETGASVDFRVESNTNENMLFVDGSADKVGIGESAPLAPLHVKNGDSGVTSVGAGGGSLLVESSGNSGITIANPNTSIGSIYFADPDDDDAGRIRYYHEYDLMNFVAAGTEVLRIDASKIVINENSADVDFRVESNGNTHMLFVDGGNDRVGIGTSVPSEALQVNGSVGIGGNDGGSAGLLNVYGGATGEGGEIRIFPSAAEDTTIDHWSLDCATDDLRIFSSVGDLAIVAAANGATSLYHDGSGKLTTSSGGIVVTGTVSATAGSTLLIVNSSGTTLKTIKGMS